MDLIVENVRCFCNKLTIPVRPLTLLVGENSTGKTTFLAMLQHVSGAGYPELRPSFNVEPFELGTYDSIATFRGGSFGRARHFSVGARRGSGSRERTILSTYISYKGQPQLSGVMVKWPGGRVSVRIDQSSHEADVRSHVKGMAPQRSRHSLKVTPGSRHDLPFGFVLQRIVYEMLERAARKQGTAGFPDGLTGFFETVRVAGPAVVALGPVRTKPKRTYDVISDDFTPEGDHIPVMLARVLKGEDAQQRQRLVEALFEFGTNSGLFRRIAVKPLGKRPSDPFQILVSTGGPSANLLDVGYGVSQALPLVVQSVIAQSEGVVQLLLQQPEVHLHPRAQAELGTFFAKQVAKGRRELVIETHSDFILDRIRMEVAKGTVDPAKILILYFERCGASTKVHPIDLGPDGGIRGAPPSYRQFFLREETALLRRV